MNAKVFINYRREDTRHAAGRLYDRLIQRFGEDQVFMDIDQIEPGEDFVEVINRKVSACDIAIVAIGPHWLGATDQSGKRRLDDEEDFVRMEIVAALERNIRVIPVLVDGARMPGKHDLPEALAPLSRRNAIELSETRFHVDVNRLIEAIEKSVAVPGKSVELPPMPAAPPLEPVAVTPLQPESKDLAETSEFTKPAELKEPTTLGKPTQTTQSPPAIPAVASISAIAALKESAVWTRKGLIIVSAVGATVIVLLAITWSLTRPHPSLTTPHPSLEPSAENDYSVATKFANGVGGIRIDLPKAAEYLQRAAAKNVPEAEARLAVWVNNGTGGLAKDNVKGEQWAKKALADGLTAKATNSADAQSALAVLYELGLGVSKDFGKAVELYQKAADQGNAGAQNRLATLYYDGQGVPKDLGKSLEFYQKAADQGHAAAQNHLGWLYQTGRGVPMDLGKAVELYQKAADHGYAAAQYNLGWLYKNGQGVPKDLGKTAELFQKAADQGHAKAQYNLGWLYENGWGVPEDLGKATELYQKAANQGDHDAIASLKRLSKPAEPKLTDQGDAAAQFNLGMKYQYGWGVPKDLVKAAEFYQKAADQGHAEAQNKLAALYENGQGVPKDLRKAAEFYQKAADQGYAKAQYNLGLLYENGQGVPKDLRKAAEFYQKAADQGDQDAIANLKTLSRSAETPSSQSELTGGYDPAIAFVDMQRIFKEYAKTKTAETEINDAKKVAKQEYDDRAAAYKKALDEINTLNKQLQSRAVSADKKTQMAKERDDKIANIKNMEREISDFRNTRERQLQEQLMRMREGIVKEITDKIRELAGSAVHIIFDKSGMSINGVPVLLYSPDRADISDKVTNALNNGSNATLTTTTTRNLKIAALDMQSAFKNYNKTKTAEAEINDAKTAAKREYDDRAEAYKKALDEINTLNKQLQSRAVSADKKTQMAKERDDKIANIKNMEREISDFRNTRERQLQEQLMRMREGIVKEITDVLMNAVKTNNIDVVLDISGMSINGAPVILYRHGIPDFTDEAVAKLNGTSFSGNMLASSDPSRTQRFGVVDMQRAFQAWPETKAAEAKINDEKAAAKNDYASQSQEEREKRNKQIEDDRRKLREPIVAKIEATVNTCAERAGFNLVFDSSGNSINGVPVVLFARDLPDLTDAVLRERDRSP